MRIIDADALLDRLEMLRRNYTLKAGYRDAMTDAIGEVRDALTIDAVPVVHGDFEKYPEEVILNLRVTPFLCKTCRTTFITLNKEGKRLMFCSYCGAKMDGGEDGENA